MVKYFWKGVEATYFGKENTEVASFPGVPGQGGEWRLPELCQDSHVFLGMHSRVRGIEGMRSKSHLLSGLPETAAATRQVSQGKNRRQQVSKTGFLNRWQLIRPGFPRARDALGGISGSLVSWHRWTRACSGCKLSLTALSCLAEARNRRKVCDT